MNEFLVNILLPILSILIPVFATVYTVNKRIREQNRENHQPYLVLNKVESIDEIDKYSYYLTLISQELSNKSIEDVMKDNENNRLATRLIIRNIGYGVATNIKFYNLLNSEQISGMQKHDLEKNQKLFTTFDLESVSELEVQLNIISQDIKDKGSVNHNRILCVYKDLNDNVFDFIISINIKTDDNYDFFAYQPSSSSYKKWINENKKQYTKIIKKYQKQ